MEFNVQGKNYVLNFKRMEQANKSTRVRRKVRFLKVQDDEEGMSFYFLVLFTCYS